MASQRPSEILATLEELDVTHPRREALDGSDRETPPLWSVCRRVVPVNSGEDDRHACHTGGYPAQHAPLWGVRVDNIEPFAPEEPHQRAKCADVGGRIPRARDVRPVKES